MSASLAGIYTRTSRSPLADGGGGARQEAECRILAADLGVDVVEVYSEGDATAFGRRPRPEFARLLADVASHEIDMVIAWHPDRLYRRQRDLVPFIDTVQAAGARVATVETGELDLASSSGRMVARIVGALAEHESEHRAERLRLKHEELARVGRWPGGKRPYGYRYVGDGMLEIDADEAAIIREAADRLIGGESVSAICRDLTRRRVPTANGGLWYTGTLVGVLTKPSVYGYRAHRSGEPVPGAWEPILDQATVERIRELKAEPNQSATRARLLRGLLRCGRCGSPLKGGRNAYRCIKPPEGRGCGSLLITASRADDAVLNEVLRRSGFDRGSPLPPAGRLASVLMKATQRDHDSIVDRQRSLIRSVVERIVVQPAAQRGGRFDRSRVIDGIEWREPV